MNTTIARYVLGIAGLAVISGSLGLAALTIRRRTLPDLNGAPVRLAETIIGLAILIGILVSLGLIGLFAFAPIVVACLLAGLASLRSASSGRRRGRPRKRGMDAERAAAATPGRPVRSRRAGITAAVGLTSVIALAAGAAVIAEWGTLTGRSYDVGIRGFDSLWYHLPWAAGFAQTGSVTPLHFTDVEYLTPFYPATAELLHGLGIVLLGRDTLSPALNLLWLGLTLLSGYCIGRPRGTGAAAMLGVALAMASTMMDYSQAGSAANDVVAIFFLLAAVALFVNGSLGLGGIAAGLAVGTKLTVLAPVLALTVGVIAIAPRDTRPGTAARWLGPLLLAGGFWYARNLIAVGNPFPWTGLHGLLPSPAPPLQQHTGYSVVHYLGSGDFWSRFAQPALAAGLGRWWFLIVGAAVAGPVLCLAWPSSSRLTRMLGLVSLAALAGYLVTPETAAGPDGDPVGFAFNLRYLAPALTLCLAITPLAPPLAATTKTRAATAAAVAITLGGTIVQPRLWPSPHAAGAVAIGLAAALGLAALALKTRRRAIFAAAAVALAIAGYALQAHYLRGRYAYHPNVSSLARVWALFRTVHHARVGIVGTFGGFFSYPLYGLDDSNRVQYIADRGPNGSFMPIATCARWRDQVNAAHLDFLITTPARDPWHPRVLRRSPETSWTESDPAAQPIYRERATGQPIVVYRIGGTLKALSCG